MKSLLITLLPILFSSMLFPQQADFADLIFKKKNNLEVTKRSGHKFPAKFYLLSQTSGQSIDRFKFNKHPGRHHEASEPYIFKDTAFSNLFSEKEKTYLIDQVPLFFPRTLTTVSFRKVHLIESFSEVKRGYFFQITDPLYSSDSSYAFIDVSIYYRTNETEVLNDAYYGSTFFTYKRAKKGKWTLLKKQADFIL